MLPCHCGGPNFGSAIVSFLPAIAFDSAQWVVGGVDQRRCFCTDGSTWLEMGMEPLVGSRRSDEQWNAQLRADCGSAPA